MRTTRSLEILAMLLIAVPNVVFSIGCILPGCGDGPAPPDAPRAEAHQPESEPLPPALEDTASALEPALCDDAPASIDLWRLETDGERSPLGDKVAFEYSGGCGGDPSLWIEVAAAGIAAGAVDVGWTLSVDGEDPVSGEAAWQLGCAVEGGLQAGRLSFDLPLSADGAAVLLEIVMIDAAGNELHAEHSFIASVSEG